MSSSDDLAGKLAALSKSEDSYDGSARRIADQGMPLALQAILTEIDETVLTRALRFQLDDKAVLTVVAANRRLLGIQDLEGGKLKAVDDLKGQALSPDDEGQLKTLKSVLNSATKGIQAVTVTTAPAERIGNQRDAGLGIERLAALAGLEYPFVTPTRLGSLLMGLNDAITASFHRKPGEDDSFSGADSEIDWLKANIDSIITEIRQPNCPFRLTTIGQQCDDFLSMSVAIDGDEIAIFRHNSKACGTIYANWTSIFPQ